MENLILVVEDSASCQKIAIDSLQKIGVVAISKNLAEAREYLKFHHPNLIVLDLILPDGNGFEFFEELQSQTVNNNIPVIFVSGSDDVSHKVAALSAGAQDYVVKPYSPLELRARANRVFRIKNEDSVLRDSVFGLSLDLNTYKVTHHSNGKSNQIDVTPNEFKILVFFLRNKNRIFSRQQIIDFAWGSDVFITPRTVDTHISTLRKKLNNTTIEIQSVRGEGYRVEAKQSLAC